MVEIVEYQPKHLTSIRLRAIQDGEKPLAINTYAVTFIDAGEPIAIFGAYYPVHGVAHIWGLCADSVKKHPIQFFHAVQNYLAKIEQDFKLRRVQIDVREDYLQGHKWACALGFKLEARLNNYYPDGSNAMLYARTP